MKTSTRLAAIVAVAGQAAAHLRLPITSRSAHGADAAQLQRRSSSTSAAITHINSAYASYVVNVTVGTPPQDVALMLSVGDSGSWVPDASYCSTRAASSYRSSGYMTCDYGAFNVNLSSSWARDLDDDGYDQTFSYGLSGYTMGNYASGKSLRETVGFAGADVSNVTLGLASSADQFVGMLGLGYNKSERYYSDSTPSFLDSALAAGLVETKAYSLWLGDEAGAAGHLLLGAVDKSAFEPPLVRYDLGSSGSSSYSSTDRISLDLASLNTSATADGPLEPFQNKTRLPRVTIDPTTPLSYLPGALAKKTWDLAGATWDKYDRWATIPCSARGDVKARIAVQFGDQNGPIINIPLSDLVMPQEPWLLYGGSSRYSSDDDDDDDDNDNGSCVFGIQSPNYDPTEVDEDNFYSGSSSSSSSSEEYVAGAGMLRRAYFVVDLANKELALAPVRFGAASAAADVVPFAQYGALMPESTSSRCFTENHYYTDNCTGDYTDGGRGGRGGSGSSSSDDFGAYSGLGRGQAIAIIVGLSIVGLVLLAVAVWGIVRCTRDNHKFSAEATKEAEAGGVEPAPAAAPAAGSTPAPATAPSQPAPPQ